MSGPCPALRIRKAEMTPDRRKQVEHLYHAALEYEESERAAFLQEACAGDEVLRREVESLLEDQERAAGSNEPRDLQPPAASRTPERVQPHQDGSAEGRLVGRTLAHYRILERIGAGGMGEVYLAHDEWLDREVAVKILPQSSLEDPSVRRRLRKEAQALSKLNHPNIETLFDFVSKAAVEFLVLEYVSGLTLSDMLQQGPLPEREIARLGVQLAAGVAAAHDQRIVHRDLKPSNVRVTTDGRLKILDFGIAKFLKPQRAIIGTDSSTDSSTDQNAVGTLPYMAPEQLRAEMADSRTDIYGVGTILYEMATAQRPFREETQHRLADSILHMEPASPRAVNPRVSPELERIILKCLQKEPENRYHSAQELVVDLRQLVVPKTASPAPPVRRAHVSWQAATLVAILAVAGAAILAGLNVGGSRDWLLGKKRPPVVQSIAVLPMENLSGNPDQDYFADGMTDELITRLAQISELRVTSRTSVMQYKGVKKPIPQIAKELSVDAIVEGSVLRAGGRVRIAAELIDPTTDRHTWEDTYERDFGDILALQSDVAKTIAQEIKIKLTPQEQVRLAESPRVNSAAYELYLHGRYYWNQRTPEGLQKGMEYFKQAIAEDPGYALAYAGLADSYLLLGNLGVLELNIAIPDAEAAAKKALELDDRLAEAHASLGIASLYDHLNWRQAEKELKLAIKLNPNYATAHQWYASTLAVIGRPEDLVREARRAQELDPLSPIVNAFLGRAYYLSRQYDDAIQQCQKALKLDPDFPVAHLFLGMVFTQKGRHEEAISEVQRAVHLSHEAPAMVAVLGYAYAKAGKKDDALRVLGKLLEPAERENVLSADIAVIYAALGEKDEAFKWLDKAEEEGGLSSTALKLGPALDNLRSDVRFVDLIHRAGLPPDQGD